MVWDSIKKSVLRVILTSKTNYVYAIIAGEVNDARKYFRACFLLFIVWGATHFKRLSEIPVAALMLVQIVLASGYV